MRCTLDDFANADITVAVYIPNFLDSLYLRSSWGFLLSGLLFLLWLWLLLLFLFFFDFLIFCNIDRLVFLFFLLGRLVLLGGSLLHICDLLLGNCLNDRLGFLRYVLLVKRWERGGNVLFAKNRLHLVDHFIQLSCHRLRVCKDTLRHSKSCKSDRFINYTPKCSSRLIKK